MSGDAFDCPRCGGNDATGEHERWCDAGELPDVLEHELAAWGLIEFALGVGRGLLVMALLVLELEARGVAPEAVAAVRLVLPAAALERAARMRAAGSN